MAPATSKGSKARRRLKEHDVAVYLRVRGESVDEVDKLVYRFCAALKTLLGRRLVVKGLEVDK